ncbi:DUF4198 domain-containing protein [Lewinella sp. IMCC34183]|uniref:DUF4198 domain-containing protein n=1 Tax=Lewinella sp. IMCC34183 TaxID=2248762 RepID=UPI000E241AE8|nr:DUF4198 domain-containing protein [Lewinella sp. IMCC34183]
MKKLVFAAFALIVLCSHDMYLKLDSYFLQPNSKVSIQLFNGTFAKSENTIDRDRMVDVSVLANGERLRMDSTQWREDGDVTVLDFTTESSGTYVAGVSTRARSLAMDAEAFNSYLEHDGVVDELERRRADDNLESDAVEKYSKHVKTIVQVGDTRTDDWQTTLGYPIEFVPLSNPYDLHTGDRLQVRLLWEGQPLADQLVIVDAEAGEHGHEHDAATDHEHGPENEGHTHEGMSQLRTDAEGIIDVEVTHDGSWFLRTIYMQDSEEEGLTHESNWATLTFAVDHGHSHAAGADQAHDHEAGIPTYAWWIGSIVLVGGLFFYFQKRA